MAIVARELVRRGEALLVIEAGADGVMLVPAASWDVRGVSIEESRWRYRCYMQGPERTTTRYVSGDMVLHFRYGVEASRPWLGRSPMAAAAATGALMGSLEAKLGQEAAGVVAHVLPIPVDPGEKEGADGDDFDPLADLKQGIRDAKGSTMFAETTASGWKQGKTEAPQQDWTPKRIGANPPDVLHLLRQAVEESVAIACGVPPSLLGSGEATAIREAWRMFVVATINPMLRSLRAQTRMKLDPSCVMSSDELIGVDQRARVFGFAQGERSGTFGGGRSSRRGDSALSVVVGRTQ